MNDIDYLKQQLNLLVGFLEVSDEEVYNQIKNHDRYNVGLSIEQLYENNFVNYKNHITTSALLLGFSHLEDYITKCIVKYLVKNPEKNDYKVTLKTIKEKGENLILSVSEEQARRLVFSDKIKFIEKNMNGISSAILNEIKFVNDVRNCLLHNNGLADKRLKSKYSEGQKILLNSGEVNGFGLKARTLATEIWSNVQ